MGVMGGLRGTMVAALLVLVACDNAEERSQAHFTSGQELVAAGEPEKAMIEFRNALQLNQNSVPPRLAFAQLLLASGQLQQAAGHYLRVIELAPNTGEARIALGRIFLIGNQPEEAITHIDAALEIAPGNLEAQALKATYEYRQGRTDEGATLARAVLAEAPGHPIASLVVANDHRAAGRYAEAIAALDPAIAREPRDVGLHLGKLRTLEAAGNDPALGVHLSEMVEIFPSNVDVVRGLAEWHLRQGNPSAAEATLRGLAERVPEDPDNALAVVAFLNRQVGQDAARAELERLVAGNQHLPIFTRAFADFAFQTGTSDEAIERLQGLLETELTTTDRHLAQTELADILRSTGNLDGAVELANQVLSEDAGNVAALKIRAIGSIEGDRPNAAIADLRAAVDGAPDDSTVLTLMALAHERNGSRGLAQERLAQAVQISNAGVTESLRFAEFLLRDNKPAIAATVLLESVSANGDVPELLIALSRIRLGQEDWTSAESLAGRLEAAATRAGNERAVQIASETRAAALSGQEKFDTSIGILREMWNEAGERTTAMETLTRTYIQTGRAPEAADFLDEILETEKTNLRANLLRGAVHAFLGETEEAETRYRKVISDHPDRENGYGALANLLASLGRVDEADEIIRQGIENAESTVGLLLSRAARMERENDFEAAIRIYEQLYKADKLSDVLANNLASLLAEHRQDPESLERAYQLAKRLRSAPEPAFQDTYGWVLFRRGEFERALQPLTQAAIGLPENPLVQYHLGMAYAELGQTARAIESLVRAIELAGDSPLPQFKDARARLDVLREG